jgi:hypothetical protein
LWWLQEQISYIMDLWWTMIPCYNSRGIVQRQRTPSVL